MNSPAPPAPSLYEFGDFRLDLVHHQLWSRAKDEVLALTPRVFETLAYFVQHPGELLGRETLMDEIWPNTDVEANNLSQNVSTLRRVLGENPGENRFIVTVPGRGYRFIAEVRVSRVGASGGSSLRDTDALSSLRDAESYRLYTQALRLAERPTAENCRLAIEQLEAALRRDEQFAHGWSWLAHARMLAVNVGHASVEQLTAAERDAERALALQPNLATAHALRGNIAVHRGDWVAAELHYARAISLDDSDAMLLATHATFVLESVGHIEHALRKLHDASVLVPADPRMMLTLAVGHSIAGEDVQALEYAQLAVKFGFGEDVPPLPMVLALAAARAGRHADAAEHIVRMLPAVAGAAGTARLVYGALAEPSQRDVAAAAVSRMLSESSELLRMGGLTVLFVGWLAQLDRCDLAFDVADHAIETCAHFGTLPPNWQMLWLPELEPLRAHERFYELAVSLRFVDYWKRFGSPDHYELAGERLIALSGGDS